MGVGEWEGIKGGVALAFHVHSLRAHEKLRVRTNMALGIFDVWCSQPPPTFQSVIVRQQNEMNVLLQSTNQQLQLLILSNERLQAIHLYHRTNPFAPIDVETIRQLMTQNQESVKSIESMKVETLKLWMKHQNEWNQLIVEWNDWFKYRK